MAGKTMNNFTPDVFERAALMVLDHERGHASWWEAVVSIAATIGLGARTLHQWVEKVEVALINAALPDFAKQYGGWKAFSNLAPLELDFINDELAGKKRRPHTKQD